MYVWQSCRSESPVPRLTCSSASAKKCIDIHIFVFCGSSVDLKKLETGLRTISAWVDSTLRIKAVGFPTFGLLLYLVLSNFVWHYNIQCCIMSRATV